MTFDWYKKVNGFVEIEIEGYFTERFINLALSKGINIWDIKRAAYGKMVAKVIPKDFKKLKKIARITGCKIRIVKKEGLPFLAFRYHKRKIFLILFIMMLLIIKIYNSFIWKIDISGEFDIPIEELKRQLEDENLRILARKKDIDIEKIKINMALKRNDLAWIGITLKGTKAFVDVVEKVMPDVEKLAGIPCNIIAEKDGLITKIYVKDGVALVQKGDLVQKGQILISGILTSKQDENRYVHADGEIFAKTWYSNKAKVPYLRDVVTKTGNIEKSYIIKILNYQINLLKFDTKFKKYDTITSSSRFKILDRFELPIEVEKTVYEEIDVETIKLTLNQASNIARNNAMNGVLQIVPIGAENVNNSVVVREYDEGVEAEVIIECMEKIGTKEKLEG